MIIALCRHGQSDANTRRILRSSGDDLLTPLGHEQAKRLSDWASAWGASLLLTSPSLRARETCAAIERSTLLAPVVCDELAERHYGPYEGMPLDTVRSIRLERDDNFVDFAQDWHGDNDVESEFQVCQRVNRLVESIDKHSKVIAITHYGVMLSMLRGCLGIDSPRSTVKFGNCSRLVIEYGPNLSCLHEIVQPLSIGQDFA